MPSNFLKDPQSVLDYQVDWTGWLDADTIATSTWAVPDGITKDSDTNSTTKATIWLSGGTVDATYECINHIVTAGGRTDERTIVIYCEDK